MTQEKLLSASTSKGFSLPWETRKELPDRRPGCSCRWEWKASGDMLIFTASFKEESTTGAFFAQKNTEDHSVEMRTYLATAVDT